MRSPLSQFLGWVFPPFAFIIVIAAMHKAKLARLTRVFGILTVMFSIAAGFGFIYPSITYLQNLRLPTLTVYGLFFIGLGVMLIRLPNSQSNRHPDK